MKTCMDDKDQYFNSGRTHPLVREDAPRVIVKNLEFRLKSYMKSQDAPDTKTD
jgi:hypothetical protein